MLSACEFLCFSNHCPFIPDSLLRSFYSEQASKMGIVLKQRASSFTVQNNKDNVSLQHKSQLGLLKVYYKRLRFLNSRAPFL